MTPRDSPPAPRQSTVVSRRRLFTWLAGGVGAIAVAGVTGFELVDHGVLPGKRLLDQIDGACSVPATTMSFAPIGPSETGSFHSKARQRTVGYTIAYPPGHRPGERLALVVMLHGFGNNHATALFGMAPAQAVALRVGGSLLRPMAMVTVDGGDGYWNPHPGDDPMTMVIDELIPFCQRKGLGVSPNRIGLMGISMGGYGALAIAERRPDLVSALAVISPAVWTSYAQARATNAGAFASASAFVAGDVITHADALKGIPVRIASGADDPFHPGVEKLAGVLGSNSTVEFPSGCHTEPFFVEQEPLSLGFLSRHLD
ncbi:MAG TPA: alpha/beta hydrolase-fold protein [Acidimicrobiales bacterium]